MAKRRQSQRGKCIDDELGLEFVLEELRGSQAPRNKEVLLHTLFFVRRDGSSSAAASRAAAASVKARWLGSAVEVASDATLERRVAKLYELYR